MSGRTSGVDRRGAARTGSLVLLVAAAMGITGLVAALATVGGEDDDGLSRSDARADGRGDRPAADLVGTPGEGGEARVVAHAPSDPDSPTGDARLSGAVAGPGWSNGAPVEVHLRGLTAEGDEVRRELVLDGAGARWSFEDLPPGTYVARATASLEPRRAFGASDAIELAADTTEGDVVLRMREYVLEGVVTADDQVPLPGMPVTVDWSADRSAHPVLASPSLNASFASLSSGVQRLDALNEQISFEISGLQFEEFEVLDSVEVETTSTDAVESNDRARVELERAVTEARQLETIALQAATRARLEAAAREMEAAAREVESEPVILSGVVLSGEPIRGRFVDTGAWKVGAFDAEEGQERLACSTDALGRFKVWLPGPGRGSVLAPGEDAEEANERWRWYRQSGSHYAVSPEEPRTTVEIEVAHVGAITGVVTAPPRTGDVDLEVFVRSLESKGSTQHTTARGQESRDEGAFRFRNLAPGRYVIYGRSGGSAGQDVSHRAVVQVHAGAATRVDLPLATSSSVVGTLVDAEGAPIPGARITAYGEDNDNLSRNGRTDENGRFTIVGMYGGPYVVRADEHSLAREPRLRVPQGGAVVDAGTLRVAPPLDETEVGMGKGARGRSSVVEPKGR